MLRLSTLLVLTLLLPAIISCSAVKPDGPLKDLVDGELFTGDTRVAPPRHKNDTLMEPMETGGPLRWKMGF